MFPPLLGIDVLNGIALASTLSAAGLALIVYSMFIGAPVRVTE